MRTAEPVGGRLGLRPVEEEAAGGGRGGGGGIGGGGDGAGGQGGGGGGGADTTSCTELLDGSWLSSMSGRSIGHPDNIEFCFGCLPHNGSGTYPRPGDVRIGTHTATIVHT